MMILISNNVKIQKIQALSEFNWQKTLQKSKQTNNQTVIRDTNQ